MVLISPLRHLKNRLYSAESVTEADSALRTVALSRERVRLTGESVFFVLKEQEHTPSSVFHPLCGGIQLPQGEAKGMQVTPRGRPRDASSPKGKPKEPSSVFHASFAYGTP
jgi:hypothetical protein